MIIIVSPSVKMPGGISTVATEQCKWFSVNKIEFCLIETANGVGWRRCVDYFIALLNFIYLLLFCEVSVVHFHISSRGSTLRKCILAIFCVILKVPYVFHLHGSEFKKFYNSEINVIGKYFVNIFFLRAEKIIALSLSWKVWIEATLNAKNVVVIHNGVNSIDRKSKHSRAKTILFLGRVGKRKGVDTLLKAMVEVVKVIPDSRLVIGGDGDIDSFQSMMPPLGGSVTFLGWIGPEDKEKELNNAAVYCLPSWNEGLPMSILEAMSAGLPVVSTPVGGIPEAVIHGQNGYLVPPGDDSALAQALIRLLSDPELATKMGHEGRRLYEEHFSADRMCASFVELYDSCKKI